MKKEIFITKTESVLKKLGKDMQFPTKGEKNELIYRILNPENYIRYLKRKYHYEVECEKPKEAYFSRDTTQQEVNEFFARREQFDEDRYEFKNGKIKERLLYWFEVNGEQVTPFFANMMDDL